MGGSEPSVENRFSISNQMFIVSPPNTHSPDLSGSSESGKSLGFCFRTCDSKCSRKLALRVLALCICIAGFRSLLCCFFQLPSTSWEEPNSGIARLNEEKENKSVRFKPSRFNISRERLMFVRIAQNGTKTLVYNMQEGYLLDGSCGRKQKWLWMGADPLECKEKIAPQMKEFICLCQHQSGRIRLEKFL